MNKSFLNLVDVPNPCEKSWDEMIGNEQTRHCLHCDRDIHNLSEISVKEAQKLLFQSKGRVCVRLMRDADDKIQTNDRKFHQISRKSRIAAGVLSATLSLTNVAFTQSETVKVKSGKNVHQTQTQKNTSRISFTILDLTGAIISEAEVKLTHDQTKREFISNTNEKGVAHFSFLPQGRYQVKASARGFRNGVMSIVVREKVEPNIEMTLEVGASVGVVDINWYEIPIFNSILQEDFEVVRKYIASKKNVNLQDHNKVSMLHVAAQSGNIEIIRLLLKAGANINARDKQGRTPFLMIGGDDEETGLKIIKLFIAKGADVNVRDKDNYGMTLLMGACDENNLEWVKLLLKAGANPNLKDDDGETAMMKTTSEEIKKLLKKYGAKE